MTSIIHFVLRSNEWLTRSLDLLQPLFLLSLRLYVANVFFKSGLTKINDFSSTVALFENEYQVPFISPELAAISGTAAELLLPILFALGFLSRPTALALFVFNIIAVVSYPEISAAGIKDHVAWGAMIAVIVFFGPGKIAIDQWVNRWFGVQIPPSNVAMRPNFLSNQ